MSKICTDLEQSKELAKFLPLASSDTRIGNYVGESGKVDGTNIHYYTKGESFGAPEIIYAWSLVALLDVLPIIERKGYQKDKPRLLYNVAINKWVVDSHVYTTDAYDNQIDACFDMIEKLHELKML